MLALQSHASMTTDQDQYLQTITAFTASLIEPNAHSIDENGIVPLDLGQRLVDQGLHTLGLRNSIGGSEASLDTTLLVIEVLANASSAVGALMVMSHAATALLSTGVSPNGILTANAPQINIAQDDCFTISGIGEIVSTLNNDGPLIVQCFSEGLYTIGFIASEDIGRLDIHQVNRTGLRGLPFSEVALENVAVQRIAHHSLATSFHWQILGWSAVAIAVANKALRESSAYLIHRRQFGSSLSRRLALAEIIGKMSIAVSSASAQLVNVSSRIQLDEEISIETLSCARLCAELAISATLDAVQLHGGYGYIREMPVERLMRDAISIRARISSLGATPAIIGARYLRGPN